MFYYGWIKGLTISLKCKEYDANINHFLLHKDLRLLCRLYNRCDFIREFWKGYTQAVSGD